MLYLWILLTMVAISSAEPMTLDYNDEVIIFAFKEAGTFLMTTKNVDEVMMGTLVYASTEFRLGRRYYLNLLVHTKPDDIMEFCTVELWERNFILVGQPLTIVEKPECIEQDSMAD